MKRREFITLLGGTGAALFAVELPCAALAQELIASRPDVIVATGTPITATLQRETRAIPIVFTTVSDPIGAGFVASLSRPGAT